MTFAVVWFVLWGVLWAAYFMLDGFDLGAGMLYHVLGKSESDRALIRRSIGPMWDGNEVWLLTAGGATFAAFPAVYASMFSYLYTALLIILFGLIFRGVSIEFRAKMTGTGWGKVWDAGFALGSLAPALLFGVAFGNIFRGLPMDAAGYHGTLLFLLNPYGLLTGALFVALFLVHGALWVALKTGGDLAGRSLAAARKLWLVEVGAAILFLAATPFETKLFDNYSAAPVLFLVPGLAVAALIAVGVQARRGRAGRAFAASCAAIVLVTATGLVGLYPNLLPSRLDPASSLTLFNASSSPYTLKIMTVVALIFVPIVIAYQVWVYRIFRTKIAVKDAETDSFY
ncbi:MAG: cytochrome d ubiquinol oxidase subunit II [Candidatus Aminicenantes bacterium]|nr:cytochrome d ubiquinol oxidase subunit II [Candidatus Aminicenantes bacterium]